MENSNPKYPATTKLMKDLQDSTGWGSPTKSANLVAELQELLNQSANPDPSINMSSHRVWDAAYRSGWQAALTRVVELALKPGAKQ